jgi:DNA-binding CsgD family transcriptional regulator
LSDWDAIRLALKLEDEALADRLRSLLRDVPGLKIVPLGEKVDAVIAAEPASEVDGTAAALTAREVEVLALLAEGASNKVIARHLGISVHTAKFHVRSLIDKLDAVGRTDVVAHAARLGVIRI